ncbi:MAG: bifunctional methylenetetrahydrofolate dehydrogenase/methenyltetrahydrofolate cyclohydrolase FolD [Myxococcales bacterium]|nr:bifunctional methylenetetrahydrofolate dehydrogenase/methenyltetrahydrofolate cyclohydrolase FolD [Myxococcales bacterium]
MSARIIDGKALAKKVRRELKARVETFAETHRPPGLAVVLVGDDPASAVYVRNKTRGCRRAGIEHFDHILPADTSQQALIELVDRLAADQRVDGILVQLPLPAHVDARAVLARIPADKDVDGFLPENIGRLVVGEPGFVACTPAGVMRLLDEAETPLEGAEALVIGRSNIVGKPMGQLLLARNCTVTMCHSRTRDLAAHVARADVVVAAVGRAEMVRGEWVKSGATVIDVGTNRVGDKLVGDVEFAAAAERARAITPVPGGVGPMTIAMLLSNTVDSAVRRLGIS